MDGSYVTPGGNIIPNHGVKGTGDIYIDDKGWTPEEIDDVISNPAPGGYETGIGDGRTGKKGFVVFGPNGEYIITNEDGEVRGASDRKNPEWNTLPKRKDKETDREESDK